MSIKFEKTAIVGWDVAIRGMRNPLESWDKSDSGTCGGNNHIGCLNCTNTKCGIMQKECNGIKDYDYQGKIIDQGKFDGEFIVGKNDLDLMKRLVKAGTDHRKFLRMITVYVDITAPIYWWKEFDTYKVGTVANSCSTMHCIHKKEFTREDFSCEHLLGSGEGDLIVDDAGDIRVDEDAMMTNKPAVTIEDNDNIMYYWYDDVLDFVIIALNSSRDEYLRLDKRLKDDKTLTDQERKHLTAKRKAMWWQMIQLLPSSYNQKRTVMLNYEVLSNIYKSRKGHKLDEWADGFIEFIERLPYSELITGKDK